jgi:hypothetical protein
LTLVVVAAWLSRWYQAAPVLRFVPLWATDPRTDMTLPPLPPRSPQEFAAFTQKAPSRNLLASANVAVAATGLASLSSTLNNLRGSETLVVYLSARGDLDPADPKTVRVLDVGGNGPANTITLDAVFQSLMKAPTPRTLLILDLHPIPSSPWGGPADDLADAIQTTIGRFPSFPGLILTSCEIGQSPLWSEALGRSVFGFHVEEGLRGWADTSPPGETPDGRITVRELARYLGERVGDWARICRGVEQTVPPPFGGPGDFTIGILPRSGPSPHLALEVPKAPPSYPKWIREGWELRDRWRIEGVDDFAPRAIGGMEAVLLQVEHDWRSGTPGPILQGVLKSATEALRDQLGQAATIPHPRPASLAQEALIEGRVDDPALISALKATLAKRAATPPAEIEAATPRLIAEFDSAVRNPTEYSLASAVFQAAPCS